MARSHVAVALGAALFALLITFQLAVNLGCLQVGFWHWRLNQGQKAGIPQTQFYNAKDDAGNAATTEGSQYLLGVGKADITGPVVELNLMGYANLSQVGTGLRQRLYSRAFIVGDPEDSNNRFVYMVLDTHSGDTAIRYGILEGLADLGPEYSVYSQKNVAITGTHSHSGPGAWLNYLLPQITSLGFNKQSYQAIVDGAILSIQRAHESLELGTVNVGTTNIQNANINRSLYAYLANPKEERDRYSDNVDKTMTLLKFTRASDGKDVGVLTWFAVHGTSLLGNQTIIAADNKGVAAYLFEQEMKGNSNAADGFVAGFSQSNVGDTSPNVLGAWCEDGSNTECKLEDSTCGNRSEACHGRGPYFGLNDGGTKSCYEIGRRQFAGALDLYNSMAESSTTISGSSIRSLHTFVDFSNFTFVLPNGSIAATCPAAMGHSFAAGTSDGPGAFDFKQNDSGSPDNPLWNVVGGLISKPSHKQIACQYPKPILLNVGEAHRPYDWSPNIVDIQVFRIGQLIIIVSPGEATTMSGRRWREAVYNAAVSSSLIASTTSPIVVLGGPANSYTHYITTEEEYGIQRYEGASTLYGPNTLNAYINATLGFLPYLSDTSTDSSPFGPFPPNNVNRSLSFITGVVFDAAPLFKSFGDVIIEVSTTYTRGAIVSATFVGANPRNNLRLEDTYAAVEKENDDGSWTRVKDDEDWELLFEWTRTNKALGHSNVIISWDTGIGDPEPGVYRIKYYGDSKSLGGKITGFEGTSAVFTLV
ncbi:Neutral/alkaline nonlysosomal ceramidase [Lepidopterella palustris CBS 459.81]|uniref:Neutral ceramidase n=1 Tax=Lepidopterella palustris CBS 459.81 TaxID=1314670 RepID=A0A8E2EFT0_9PEZI|nr:Neutral/alkaline nonlysosomal ceramidase [Lepidopterella palustris CBS 459.81]